MRSVIQNRPDTITVTLRSLATGDPKTGILYTDITLYYRKDGGSPTAKSIDAGNFREVDAANMPGLYEIDFTASDFDTEGEFVFVIAENGGADLAQSEAEVAVEGPVDTNLTPIVTYEVEKDSPLTIGIKLTRHGQPVTGLTLADFNSYLIKNGQESSAALTLTEIDSVNLPGFYSLDIPASATDTLGDLLVALQPLAGIIFTTEVEDQPGALTADSGRHVFVKDADTALIAPYNGFNPTTLIQTTDGGDTWTTNATGTPFDGAQSVEGLRSSNFYGVGGNSSPQVNFLYSTDLVAWSTATEGTFTITENVTDVTVISNTSAFLSCGSAIAEFDGTATLQVSLTTSGVNQFNAIAHSSASTICAAGYNNNFAVGEIQVSTDTGGTWSTADFGGGGQQYHDIDFALGTNTGWAVGDGGILKKSTDGGSNWASQTSGTSEDLFGVVAISATEAWIVGDNGTILRTEDGGVNWTEPDFVAGLGLTTETLRSIDGVDGVFWVTGDGPSEVYILNFYEVLAPDLDASEYRVKVVSPAPDVLNPSTTSAYEVTQGEAFTLTVKLTTNNGEDALTVLDGDVSKTVFKNGAIAAVTDPVVTEINSSTAPGFYSLDVASSVPDTLGDLVIALEPSGAAGGLVGEQETPPVGLTRDGGLDVFVRDANTAFIGPQNGVQASTLIQTSDGGDTWVTNPTLTPFEGARAVSGLRSSNFTIAGSSNSGVPEVVYTSDFSSYSSASDTSFTSFGDITDLTAISETSVFGVVSDGYIVEFDGTANLQLVYFPSSQIFRGISHINSSIIAAAGYVTGLGPGQILRSTDGGSSWSPVLNIGGMEFHDIDFVGAGSTRGWAVGTNGSIYITLDSGANWSSQSSGTSETLQGVIAVSDTEAWAVGTNGTLIRTTDTGSNWDPVTFTTGPSLTGRDLKSIDGVDGVYWIVGDDGASDIFILNVRGRTVVEIDPVEFRAQVVPDLDLTPVITDLDEIKGAGFVTGTDSLVNIRTNVDTVDTVVDGIDVKVTDVQGAGFNSGTDSLESLRDKMDTDFVTVTGALSDIQGAGFDTATDSLQQIRDNCEPADLTPVLNAISNLDTDVSDLATEVDTISASVTRLLGLSQENYRIVNQTYNDDNKLESASIRIFGSKADAASNSSPIAIYALSATYDSQGLLIDYLVTREA